MQNTLSPLSAWAEVEKIVSINFAENGPIHAATDRSALANGLRSDQRAHYDIFVAYLDIIESESSLSLSIGDATVDDFLV